MNKKISIGLFVYDFEHRKSKDFLDILLSIPSIDLTLFAAPWKSLSSNSDARTPNPSELKSRCRNRDVAYIETCHDNKQCILDAVEKFDINLGIIAGARIIPKDIIELFTDGIINFHPGKIPETSGLDSLHYTIKNNVPLGVSVHFINHKVDAGRLIFFKEVLIDISDKLLDLNNKSYDLQLDSLEVLISNLAKNNTVTSTPIFRPLKNCSLTASEKNQVEKNLNDWKVYQYISQIKNVIFDACKKGNLSYLQDFGYPKMIVDLINEKGWSTLVVAAYNQHSEICQWLIDNGADVNFQTLKGTSVLMFAKTNADMQNLETLNIIIENGANDTSTDIFGKNVHEYLLEKGNTELSDYIKKLKDGN